MTENRVRYFNGQFLQEEDFQVEQAYHLDRQRRHNRTLHTPGIADGLEVTANVGSDAVEVASGTAIDRDGRMIVLEDSRLVAILVEHRSQTVWLVISYRQETSRPATVGSTGDTRIHERPNVELFIENAAPPAETHIRLARLVITAGGTVSDHQRDVRVNAGVRLGGELELQRLRLARDGVDPSRWPTFSSGAAGRADVDGGLRVNGTLSADALADNLVRTNAIEDNAVTVWKLNTQGVARNTITINAGSTERVAVSAPIPSPQAPPLTQVLVSAFSPTPSARFSWTQGATTTGNMSQQVVFFRNEGVNAAEVRFEIYVLAQELDR
jgi:hypothetical protein